MKIPGHITLTKKKRSGQKLACSICGQSATVLGALPDHLPMFDRVLREFVHSHADCILRAPVKALVELSREHKEADMCCGRCVDLKARKIDKEIARCRYLLAGLDAALADYRLALEKLVDLGGEEVLERAELPMLPRLEEFQPSGVAGSVQARAKAGGAAYLQTAGSQGRLG